MTTDRWHLMTLQLGGQPVPAPPAIPGRQHRGPRDPLGVARPCLQWRRCLPAAACWCGVVHGAPGWAAAARARHENAMGPSQGGVERVRNEFEIALVNGQLIWS